MTGPCIRENIHHFQASGYFCDVILRGSCAGQKSIKAHRLILASNSEYFKAMFTHNMIESYTEEILIEAAPHEILSQIIDFCYTGTVEVDKYNVEQLMYTANFFGMTHIEFKCSQYLHNCLNQSNVWSVLSLAQELSINTLTRHAIRYALTNFDDCYKTPGFCDLCVKQLGQVLSSDILAVKREENVYEAVLHWVRYDSPNRQKYLPSLLQHVRGELMERMFIFRVVAREELITNNSESRKFLYKALDCHVSQNTATKSNITSQLRNYSDQSNNNNNKRRGDCCDGRIFVLGGRSKYKEADVGIKTSKKNLNMLINSNKILLNLKFQSNS